MSAPALGGLLTLVCTGGPPGYILEASLTLPACIDCITTTTEILEGVGAPEMTVGQDEIGYRAGTWCASR